MTLYEVNCKEIPGKYHQEAKTVKICKFGSHLGFMQIIFTC